MEERKKHEIHWVNREDANFPERLKKLTACEKAVTILETCRIGKLSAAVVGQE